VGIRRRLLTLSIGIAIPLTLVGLAVLWGLWRESRRELDHSIEEQSELAAVAFERWVDGQRQSLSTLAAITAEHPRGPFPFAGRLSFIVNTRPHWIDLQILDDSAAQLVTQPPNSKPLPGEVLITLQNEMRRRNSWAVVTDWTAGEGHPVLALAVPVTGGGMIVARIDGAAMGELFRNIELPEAGVIAVFDSQRRVLYRSSTTKTYFGTDRSDSPLFTPLSGQSRAVVETISPYDGIKRVYGLVVVGSTDCVVAIGVPSATLYSPARKQISRYLIFSFLALLCAVVAAILVARGIARPVLRLRNAAKQFGAGELTARAHVKGEGELEELGAAFDEMAARIESRTLRLAELDRLKSEFVGGVSHELRTPLTTIKTLTRLMLRGRESEAERREYLETIAAECDRQIDLVLNLLDLSRIEAGAFKISCTRVDVTEIVRACILIERHAANMRLHDLRAEYPDQPLFVNADASALRRVICGLVENAIKYTPDGGCIGLSARQANEEVAISVTDTGKGINAEDVPHVFEKFYRGRPAAIVNDLPNGHPAPEVEAPGIGLGLYLARTIIEQLGGRIEVRGTGGNGTNFTVYLRPSEASECNEEYVNVEATTHS
jgi:signal transduction histidine kinase